MATTTVTGYYFDDDPFKVTPGAIVYADDLNLPLASISSAFDTILDNIRTGSKIRSGEDTGIQNLYEINLDPPLSEYVEGQEIWLKGLNANTGASTINVNGIGAKQIKRAGLYDLQGDEIGTTFYTGLKYCGGVFIITGETKRSIYDNDQAIAASINAAISENNAANCAAESNSSAIAAGISEDNAAVSAAEAAISASEAAESAQEAAGVAAVTAGDGITITGTPSHPIVNNNSPNVTTDLSIDRDSTTVTIESSDGENAIIAAATTSEAGIQTADDKYKTDRLEVENDCINGAFDDLCWQRGTSQTANGYLSADRWRFSSTGTTHLVNKTVFPVGQSDVHGFTNYLRNQLTISVGSGNQSSFEQRSLDVQEYAGKKVCVVFEAKADIEREIALEGQQRFVSSAVAVDEISPQKITIGTDWGTHFGFIDFPSVLGETIDNLSSSTLKFWLDAGSDFNANTDSLGQQTGSPDFAFANIRYFIADKVLPTRRKTAEESLVECQRYARPLFIGGASLPLVYCNDSTSLWVQTLFFEQMIQSPDLETEPTASPKRRSSATTGTISSTVIRTLNENRVDLECTGADFTTETSYVQFNGGFLSAEI